MESPTDTEMVEIVESTWTAFLGVEVHVAPVGPLPPKEAGCLLGSVAIEGGRSGVLTLLCTRAMGLVAAKAFFADERKTLGDEEIHEAVAELANVLGGNVKGLFAGAHQLLLPGVTDWGGGDGTQALGRTFAFAGANEQFWVGWREGR